MERLRSHLKPLVLCLRLCKLVAVGSLLSCCTLNPKVYPQHPLVDEILTARPGHTGKLTNQFCVEYKDGKCINMKLTEYDLKDEVFRKTVNTLNFICNVGGRRFKVCMDKPGLCRHTYTQKCVLFICGKKNKEEEYISSEDKFQFLLDAKTKCFNKEQYPFSVTDGP